MLWQTGNAVHLMCKYNFKNVVRRWATENCFNSNFLAHLFAVFFFWEDLKMISKNWTFGLIFTLLYYTSIIFSFSVWYFLSILQFIRRWYNWLNRLAFLYSWWISVPVTWHRSVQWAFNNSTIDAQAWSTTGKIIAMELLHIARLIQD